MPMSDSELSARFKTLEEEFATLQRRFRYVAAFLLALVLLGGLVLYSQFNARFHGRYKIEANAVESNRFLLNDDKGKQRASLELDDQAVRLQLYDGQGKPRAVLGVTHKGTAGIGVLDENGTMRAAIGINDDEPVFLLNDADSRPRVSIHMAQDQPIVRLVDENQQDRVKLLIVKEGASLLVLDETGKTRAEVGVDKNGPTLNLRDAASKTRANLNVLKDGPIFTLTDDNGKPLFSKP